MHNINNSSNESLNPAAQKIRDFYALKADAPIYKREFGWYVLERWIKEGYLKPMNEVDDYDAYLRSVFGFDEPAVNSVYGLGWCEAALFPAFKEEVLEDRGAHELIRDFAGRTLLVFKNRRQGFMPEYVDHPVTDIKSFEENIKWRLDANTENRDTLSRTALNDAIDGQKRGNAAVQCVIGGYMYLRSLIGPERLLYTFYDDPNLIHECMKTWFSLADTVIARHQNEISFDELFLAEDICYNSGALISPDMMREFLIPYYTELYENMKKRNRGRKLHFQIDTDGYCNDVIDIYRSVGCDYMSPFEVAAGCDVVKIAKKYPELLISGGIDKRIIAKGGDDIKRHLDYIMPFMRKRGGYIPTCDHGVPEEVSFENYMLYRKLMNEYCD